MRDPDDPTAQPPTETLRVGPTGSPLLRRIPARWRQRAGVLIALVLGVLAGGGAVLWEQGRTAPPTSLHVYPDEHAVELVLFESAQRRTHPRGRLSDVGALQVKSAVLLSGGVPSTVWGINSGDHTLDVRAPALPVTVTPTARFQSIDLTIMVRDCEAAILWTPADRPFTITWRDEHGREHLDRAGDFDRPMARSLTRYIEAACGDPLNR